MKQPPAYTVLLVLAAVFGSLLVWYNLVGRTGFPVTVRYVLPATASPPQAASSRPADSGVVPEEPEEVQAASLEEQEAHVRFPLDLNTATIEQLELVPGIGNITAQRIVQYRDVLGAYTAPEQLMEIKGIGEHTFASVAPYVYIAQQTEASLPQEPPHSE